MQKLNVIKIGGNIIDNNDKLAQFLQLFSAVPGYKILVHGGGKVATQIGTKLGIESKYVDGRRITDEETIDLVTMVYAGLINKQIVAGLQSFGCNAFGVTGADGNLIPADKRPPVKAPSAFGEGVGGKAIDFGFVGDVQSESIPAQSWKALLDNRFVPIVAPITHNGEGQLLNTNADTIAQEVAKSLAKDFEVSLIYCFEKKGVLLDVEDDFSVIPKLTFEYFAALKAEGKIFAGMLPKLDNAFGAIRSGVNKVIIGLAEELPLLLEGNSGTTIVYE